MRPSILEIDIAVADIQRSGALVGIVIVELIEFRGVRLRGLDLNSVARKPMHRSWRHL